MSHRRVAIALSFTLTALSVVCCGLLLGASSLHAQSVSFQGIITPVASGHAAANVATDSVGNVYFSEGNEVYKMSALTQAITLIAGGGSGCSQQTDSYGDGCPANSVSLDGLNSLIVDSAGNLFFDEYAGNNVLRRIRRVDATTGIISLVAGGTANICVQHTDDLGDGCPATSATISGGPDGLAVDAAGNVYYVDSDDAVVRAVNMQSSPVTLLGVAIQPGYIAIVAGMNHSVGYSGDNGPATSAQFNSPGGLAVDASGNVFVYDDAYNHRVRVVCAVTTGAFCSGRTVGDIYTVAGNGSTGCGGNGGPAASAQIDGTGEVGDVPNGVRTDPFGNLYIADMQCQEVRLVCAGTSGVCSGRTISDIYTVAGNGTQGTSGDYGPPASAQLSNPGDVATYNSGDVYIAQGGYSGIREVQLGPVNFGALKVGASSPTYSFGFSFSSSVTVGSVAVVTQGITGLDFQNSGGTCVAGNYASGASCTVNVTFAPLAPGMRNGAVVLYDNASPANVLFTLYIYGTGTGPAIVFGPGAQTTIASDLNSPKQIAVDAAGNRYIADAGNNRVVKVSPAGTETTLLTGISAYGVAVDGAGNIYIADGQSTVYKLSPNAATPSGFYGKSWWRPMNLAVDGTGNLYIGAVYGRGDGDEWDVIPPDSSSETALSSLSCGGCYEPSIAVDAAGNVYTGGATASVIEIPANGGAQISIATDGGSAWGLAVDAAGDIYFADGGTSHQDVVEVPAGSGTPITLASASYPAGAAVDSFGNVFFTTGDNRAVKIDMSDPPTLSFPNTNLGATSAAQDVTFENIGNAQLQFSHTIPNGPFNLQGPDTTCITGEQLLNAGASCIFGIQFAPLSAGLQSGTVVLTNNALNAAPGVQTIHTSGSGVAVAPPAPAITAEPTNPTTATTAAFAFSDTESGVTFRCSLDGAAYTTCSSGVGYSSLSLGTHTFAVEAVGSSANFSTATTYSWTVNAPVLPTLTTTAISSITPTTAISGGNVASDGGAPVTAKGVCWSVSTNPTTANNCTSDGTGTGAFTSAITGLTASTQYNVRAYATNSVGTAYGADLVFTTSAPPTPQAVFNINPLAFPNTLVGTAATALPITLSNPGNAALTISSITVTGTNASNFGQTNNCGTSLAAGGTCTITVTFTPAATGSLSAAISVADNASGSPQSAVITGTGTQPQATLSPNPLSFPNTLVGTAATALPITLSNPGTAALTIGSISVTGTSASSFGQTNNCGTSLVAGGTCTITVTFTPTATGSLSASISVADNATGSPQSAVITGPGTLPQATLSPIPLAFPNTLLGTSATALPMTLSNPGTAALTITSISITGTNASSFGQTNNCGSSLAAGGTCTITVTFTPAAAASLSAAISVADNATGSPQSAVITGTGTQPQVTLNPSPLAFPNTLVGTAATALPITLSNPGNAALTISSITVTGTNASSFGQTNNCGSSLAAGGTCTITVTFTPAAAASLSAAISVADNASGSPQSAVLTGAGTVPLVPQAVLSPNPLAFPSTSVGSSATTLPMTLSNPGNAALAISNICVTGTNASSFAETNNCGTSLAAGGTCTINVAFTPASAGSLSATISITDNAAGSPQSAAITGTGNASTYVVNVTTPSAAVQPGAMAQFNIMVTPLGGSYNNMVTLSATGLPAGAQYSFQPSAVMPGSAGAPSVLSIQTSSGLTRLNPESRPHSSLPLLALLAGLPLLGLAGRLRRLRGLQGRCMLLGLAVLAALPILAFSGCGGGYFGPAPQTYTVTVTGTSGSLQETATLTLTVQ